ncbi:coenzyme F420-0:L-glutamate ligase [Candidatus Bathyarchaeota archaeon]|nr:MAG: coenzyme F420-0:L-glutamate ligase [Candidatus Bathyarchaeota archaeon]
MTYPKIEIFGVKGLPIIKPGDDLAKLICEALKKQGLDLEDGDILVVSQTIVSKAEGSIINLKNVKPSIQAKIVAEITGKEAEIVEVILKESKEIVRLKNSHLITKTKHGFVCANAGVDVSNVSGGDFVTVLPKNPDFSAKKIREKIKELTGKDVVVIISDTSGRPLRIGQINVAIGVSGMVPLLDRRGEKDLFGYELKVKEIAIADELASAAELVIGEADEGIPVALIRGYRKYVKSEKAKASILNRPTKYDLFI